MFSIILIYKHILFSQVSGIILELGSPVVARTKIARTSMPHKRLTKRAIDALKPQAHRHTAWDASLRGFGVRINADGTKTYVLKYRAGGRQRWFTIGRHGALTPDQARGLAKRVLGAVAHGKDPATERMRERQIGTVAELAERFLVEHAEAKRKPATAKEYRRMVHEHALPSLGRLRVPDVTRADVARLHHAMRDTPYQANRVLAVLSKMFGWAEARGLRPDGTNPCRQVERYPEQKRERFLSNDELARLGAVLAKAERDGSEMPSAIAAIRLLVLTGARLGEILNLRWEYVDFEHGCLRLPTSKTGAKTIPLGAPALALLAELPRFEGHPYVLPGIKEKSPLVGLQNVWERIRKRAGLEDVRLHDLRHSFASIGAGVGLSLPLIGALLGHKQPATTARYAHLAPDPVKAAADRIASQVAAALSGATGKPVAPLHAHKG
jgi:integrase